MVEKRQFALGDTVGVIWPQTNEQLYSVHTNNALISELILLKSKLQDSLSISKKNKHLLHKLPNNFNYWFCMTRHFFSPKR